MSMRGREVIFEFIPVGHIVRVTAMDTKTRTEVVIQAPQAAGEETMKQTALKKLE